MSGSKINLSEAELEIMKALWLAGEPVTAQHVSGTLKNKEWKYSTIATLFGRMVEKGAVTYEKRGRFFYYTPTVSENEYKTHQAKKLIGQLYNGSVKNLVVSLFEAKQMSPEDIEEIKRMFDL